MSLVIIKGEFPFEEELWKIVKARLNEIGYHEHKIRRSTHNWITAEILNCGEKLGFKSVPEYKVKMKSRSGYGYIDAVWLKDGNPLYGFEVMFSHGKLRDIQKLYNLPNGVFVQLNKGGLRKNHFKEIEKLKNQLLPSERRMGL